MSKDQPRTGNGRTGGRKPQAEESKQPGRHAVSGSQTSATNRNHEQPLASRLRIPRWLGGRG